MTNFLFDVDGTLTDSRCSIDEDFKKYFAEWVNIQRSKLVFKNLFSQDKVMVTHTNWLKFDMIHTIRVVFYKWCSIR